MRLRKKGELFTAFTAGSVVHSESNEYRAKWEERPVREKQYTLTADFIESYWRDPDKGYWSDMLSGDFEYVIAATVVNPSDLDPTRPDDGSRVLIIRGVLRDE